MDLMLHQGIYGLKIGDQKNSIMYRHLIGYVFSYKRFTVSFIKSLVLILLLDHKIRDICIITLNTNKRIFLVLKILPIEIIFLQFFRRKRDFINYQPTNYA